MNSNNKKGRAHLFELKIIIEHISRNENYFIQPYPLASGRYS